MAPATNGNDILEGSDYSETIYGYAGDDWLLGYGGNDFLSGGSGSDALVGGIGYDTLTGGAGSTDYFVYTSPEEGGDYLTDFNNRISQTDVQDKIYISSVGFGISPDQYNAFRFDYDTYTLFFGETPLLRTNPDGLLGSTVSTTPGYGNSIVIF